MYVSDSEGRCVTLQAPDAEHGAGHGVERRAAVLGVAFGVHERFRNVSSSFLTTRNRCFDCVNSEFPGSADGSGLNPAQITELWTIDNKTGPYIGGTEVTVTAKGLDWAKADVARPYDLSVPGFGCDTTARWADRARRTRTTSTLRVTGTVRPSQARSTRI